MSRVAGTWPGRSDTQAMNTTGERKLLTCEDIQGLQLLEECVHAGPPSHFVGAKTKKQSEAKEVEEHAQSPMTRYTT